MKNLLLILIMLVSLVLLVGVGCNGVTPPPPDEGVSEEVLQLIKEYSCCSSEVCRWADGSVSIYDATGETKENWDKINEIIDGPVVFKMSNDPTAKIGIEFQPIDGPFFVGFPQMSNGTFERCGVIINPTEASEDVYLWAVIAAAGIRVEKCNEGFSKNVETVLYWLYRLEPGSTL